MNPLNGMPLDEVLTKAKKDLIDLHIVAKKKLNLDTWPEIVRLCGDILNCAKLLGPSLKEPLRTDFLGLVEDFDDYTLNTTENDRHAFQKFLMEELKSVNDRMNHVKIDSKAA